MAERQKKIEDLANKLRIINRIRGSKPEPIITKAISLLGRHKAVEDLEDLAESSSEQTGKEALMELEKMLPEFIIGGRVRELRFLGERSSDEMGRRAISGLRKMIPEFIETKALNELKFLGMRAFDETALQAVAGLAGLKAISELSYVSMFAISEEAKKRADMELEKISSEEKFNATIEEIKALVKELE